MKLCTFDLGYGLALQIGRRVFAVRLPFPLSWASIKYLWKNRHAS